MITAKDYVYEVYREKSFTLAAKKLFVSQPALSASIKKIERELGAELFDRHSSPISLTEAGKAYIEAAEQIYAAEETLRNRINDINELRTGTVTAGGANFISSCVMPDIVKAYSEKYPGITLNLVESSSGDLKERAVLGTLDIVIDYDFEEEYFTSIPLKEEKIYLAAADGSKTAQKFAKSMFTAEELAGGEAEKKPPIDMALLEGEKLILLKKGNDMAYRASNIFREYGMKPKAFLTLDQLMTAYAMASRGLGATFVTDTMILSSPRAGAVYFPLSSRHAKRTLYLAYKRGRYIGKCLERFISTAVECMKGQPSETRP